MAEMYSSPLSRAAPDIFRLSLLRPIPSAIRSRRSYSHLYIRLMDAPGSIGFFAADNSAARFPAPNE